ncbi:MAG: GAF domain-containing protein [Phycisphaerae bacterium]|nr:GAF domain-containing protein [Phycisphaerae bacterium]
MAVTTDPAGPGAEVSDPARAAAAPRTADPVSITDFLTDGSLAGLCRQLSALTGVGVELRSADGRRIVWIEGGGWRAEEAEPVAGQATAAPLVVGGRTIGTLVVGAGAPRISDGQGGAARATLERAVALLAGAAAELCQNELSLRHRVVEVSALLRMNALLSRAASVDRVLEVAMDSALDVLGLDAGSVVLFEESDELAALERDVTHKVVRNLSRDWVECPLPLSKDRLFDHLALRGEGAVSEDLLTDARVLIPDRVRAEGLRGFINAGLTFQGRALGVVRLYSRAPRRFSDTDRRLLKSLADQAAVSIEQARLLRLEEEEKRIARQLELAADVQRRMLPARMPTVPGLDVAARYIPSNELGGDFYDLLPLGGHLGVAVGDVVGKGVAAALLMSAVRAMLRAQIDYVYDLDEVIRRVNVAMTRDTLQGEFVSLWYGVIDPAGRRLTYCSAGHEPTMLLRREGRGGWRATDLSVGGMVVGVDERQAYARATVELRSGDVLVAYTDGLTDARNFQGAKFGRETLRAMVLEAVGHEPGISAGGLVERVMWELRQFSGLAERVDDQTLVVVRVL